MKVTANYEACCRLCQFSLFKYKQNGVIKRRLAYYNFYQWRKALVNANKCYSIDVEWDEEEKEGDNNYQ